MDMAELADLTGLPVRKLRYVFDHQVLPGLAGQSPGQGIPRTFTAFEGFGIAVAAHMLNAGLNRQLVAACLEVVCRTPRTSRIQAPLLFAYLGSEGLLQIADGRYVRLNVARRPGIQKAFDSGWVPLDDGSVPPDDFTPVVLVRIELDSLAKSIREH